MHGNLKASFVLPYLCLTILLIGRVISTGSYSSIGRRRIPKDSDLADDSFTREDVAIDTSGNISPKNCVGFTDLIASPEKEIEYEVQTDQPEKVQMEHHENIGYSGNEEAFTAQNPKRKKRQNKNCQAVNLMGGMVGFRRDAMIKLEEVFGVTQTKDKKKLKVQLAKPDDSRGQFAKKDLEFLQYHATKENGETEWKNYDNLRLIYLMGVIMKIQDKRSFGGIVNYIKPEYYDELKTFFEESKHQWLEAESVISRLFENDEQEPARRIFAFRRLLHHHTSAKRWVNRLAHLRPVKKEQVCDLVDMQKAYGLSHLPQHVTENAFMIPMKKWDGDSSLGLPGMLKLRKTLVEVFGEAEARRRQRLNDYKMKRVEFVVLWCQDPELFTAHKFAIDTLTLWKVGDALQLCWNFLIDGANARMPFDLAFAQLLQIMTDKDRLFSWADSPERAWISSYYEKVYHNRLAKLGKSIILCEEINPASTSAVKNLAGDIGEVEVKYGTGLDIMLWCDLGLDPKEWFRLKKRAQSQDHEYQSYMEGLKKISDTSTSLLAILILIHPNPNPNPNPHPDPHPLAGALVLGATVTEARSIAPSPSKSTTEKIEFSTPSRRIPKRSRQESEWNAELGESDNVDQNQGDIDPLAYQSRTQSGGRLRSKHAHKAFKHQHQSSSSNAVYRTTLPDSVNTTASPVAGTLNGKLPQDIQYKIIPVSSGNSSTSDSLTSDSREYIIKPASPVAMVDPALAKQTPDGGISSSDLTGMVSHLKSQEDSEPAITLLRAIENYRQTISEESQLDINNSRSRSLSSVPDAATPNYSALPPFAQNPVNSSGIDTSSLSHVIPDKTSGNSTLNKVIQSDSSSSTDDDESSWNQ
ncbi:hypothetical protein PCASD_14084 [Puccinia coronata f. sp. avenae]|uniref:Uncharacterized protein n=1 Tax=Puccinia coronata f. sp. avenae TaxID=200324 RepID=A0A2N5TC81_9BASI|nr:hypothetical protein PCASD_14084 [Puccinia coronata f. sp. avenae]